MRVPADYPRSDREKFFLLAFTVRRGAPEFKEGSLDGLNAVAQITSSDLIARRVQELKAAA